MKLLRILVFLSCIFLLSCEGFGVFEHEHNGICASIEDTHAGSLEFTEYFCYTEMTQEECFNGNLLNNPYKSTINEWIWEMTCEEYCDLDAVPGYECEINPPSE